MFSLIKYLEQELSQGLFFTLAFNRPRVIHVIFLIPLLHKIRDPQVLSHVFQPPTICLLHVFHELGVMPELDKIAMGFIADILSYSKNKQDHAENMHIVL